MKEINGVEKQKKLVQIVLDEKEVDILIKGIEELQFEETKYKSKEKFEEDRNLILNTPWNVSTVLQNKNKKISEIVDLNLLRQGLNFNSKKIFTALRGKYVISVNIDDNSRAERI